MVRLEQLAPVTPSEQCYMHTAYLSGVDGSANPPNKSLTMAEITVNGRIKVKSFYLAFNKAYPYIHAGLRDKANKGIDPDRTMANAREMANYVPTKETPISVRGNLKVSTFEKRFQEEFGIQCLVHCRKNGKWIRLNAAQSEMTLSAVNEALKAGGADAIEPKLLT
jgi:hypothetical protein